jgi:hypothetical protein
MDVSVIIIIIITLLVFIIGIIILIAFMPKPKKTGIESSNNTCLQSCDSRWEDCQQACTNINSGLGCQISCEILNLQCVNNCYPDVYALRNGTAETLYFFNSQGRFLDSRDGLSPYRLVVQALDFPIIATYCPSLDDPNCDYTNQDLGITITDPGCYIIWYAGDGYYTTDETCAKS